MSKEQENPRAHLLRLLQSFKTAQPDFYDALEKIPEHKAWWNPIRELGDAADN